MNVTDESVRFEGYARDDGRTGVRNRVLVLPSVICSHVVADRIADAVPEAVSTPHDHGCAQIGADNEQTRRTFLGMGTNPNVAGTVVVGLGCEHLQSDEVAADLAALDVPVREISIQDAGGTDACMEGGIEAARELASGDAGAERSPAALGDLTVGIVASDLDDSTVETAEPLVGALASEVVDAGGQVLVAGTERLGAHPDAASAATADAEREKMDALVQRHREQPARAMRVCRAAAEHEFDDLTAAWDGKPFEAVVEYGDSAPRDAGVAVVDAPARFEEAATGLAAAGAQLVVHVTADGVPTGHPVVPVVKVTGDASTAAALPDDIDVDATAASADDLRARVLAVANGRPCCAEKHGLTEFAITRVGPSM